MLRRRRFLTLFLLLAFVCIPLITSATAAEKIARGGSRADVLRGGEKDDRLYGRSGSDRLYGGRGNDRLYGGRGRDVLKGGSGNDRLYGGRGRDLLKGGLGNDRLFGASGKDRLYGQRGNDLARGGSGRDRISGGRGKDRLFGQSGGDRIYGGRGNDVLSGGKGNDRLYGGPGRDRIYGGKGNDRIYSAGGGRDRIDCGPGRDTVYVDSSDRVKRCEKVVKKNLSGSGATTSAGSPPGSDGPPPPGDGSDDRNTGRDRRPNIVFILSDDQRYDTVTSEFMPNVTELLADKGLWFKKAYVSRSLCCPSRATILTGQYAHNTGVLTNNLPLGGFNAFVGEKEDNALPTWLKAAGYKTGLIGKYLNSYGGSGTDEGATYVPDGWVTFRAFTHGEGHQGPEYYCYTLNIDGRETQFYGGDPTWDENDKQSECNPHPNSELAAPAEDYDPGKYSTNVLADHALEFIGKAADSNPRQPFFLYFSPYAPHMPATPAPGDADAFSDIDWRDYHNPSYDEGDVSDKPAWVRDKRRIDADHAAKIESRWRRQLQSTLSVDRAVKRIVDKLEDVGELDNTIILYTSDNGYLHGEHRVTRKRDVYEEAVHVPLIVRGPGVRRGTTGKIAGNIDFAPTFADLAGAKPRLTVDGRSLAPLFQAETSSWRHDLLFEHWIEKSTNIPTLKGMLTDDGWKYVRYRLGQKIPKSKSGIDFDMWKPLNSWWSLQSQTPVDGLPSGRDRSSDSDRSTIKAITTAGDNEPTELELYDLNSDPYEMNSLHADPANAERLRSMDARLAELSACEGIACR